MGTEDGALEREVGVDVQHSIVIVSHHAETVVLHPVDHARSIDPGADLIPAFRIILQLTRDLMKGHPGACQHIGDFRNGACSAVGQPLTGHCGTVSDEVKRGVVERRLRREIHDHDRHIGPAYHREYGRGEGIRGGMDEEHVDICTSQLMAGLNRPLRGINQTEIHNLHIISLELQPDPGRVPLQPFL